MVFSSYPSLRTTGLRRTSVVPAVVITFDKVSQKLLTAAAPIAMTKLARKLS
jgi:hypothetical protein